MTNQQRKYWKERIEEEGRCLRKRHGGVEVSDDDVNEFLESIEIPDAHDVDATNVSFSFLLARTNTYQRLYERYRDALMRTLKDRGVQVSTYTFNRKDLAEQKDYIFEEARQALARKRSGDGIKESVRGAEKTLLDNLMAGDFPDDPRQLIEETFTKAVRGE